MIRSAGAAASDIPERIEDWNEVKTRNKVETRDEAKTRNKVETRNGEAGPPGAGGTVE